MLLGDLFILDRLERDDRILKAELRIASQHRILEGHFPGRPVLPGACLVQLVQELILSELSIDARLTEAGPIKFIALVDPLQNSCITMTVSTKVTGPGEWQVEAQAAQAAGICFRFRGTFLAGSGYAD